MAAEIECVIAPEDRVAAARAHFRSAANGPANVSAIGVLSLIAGAVAGIGALVGTWLIDGLGDIRIAAIAFGIAAGLFLAGQALFLFFRCSQIGESFVRTVDRGRAGYAAKVRWDDREIAYSWDEGSVSRVWQSIVHWRETPDLMMLYMAPNSYLVIPKRALDWARASDLQRTLEAQRRPKC